MSREHTDPRPTATSSTADDAAGLDFLNRWSRRKTAAARGVPEIEEPARDDPASDDAATAHADGAHATIAAPGSEAAGSEAAGAAPATRDTDDDHDGGDHDGGERIDERTGKRFSELTDADMPDPDTLDENADIRMFMARNVSPSLRMKALGRRFRHPRYNKVCICAEYADDYTNFEPLGQVVPHDLKTAIAREVDKLRDRLLGDGDEISREEAEARVLRERQERQERYRAAAAEHKRAAAAGVEPEPEPEPESEQKAADGDDAAAAELGAATEPQVPLAEQERAAPITQAARGGTGEAS